MSYDNRSRQSYRQIGGWFPGPGAWPKSWDELQREGTDTPALRAQREAWLRRHERAQREYRRRAAVLARLEADA